MSTTARKARKRAGIQFTKPQKVGTPVHERAWFGMSFPGLPGTKFALDFMPRSEKKKERALRDCGVSPSQIKRIIASTRPKKTRATKTVSR